MYIDAMDHTAVAAADRPDNPLDALRRVAQRRTALESEEYFEVMRARQAGISWAGIAAVLGVSKQAVHHRFRGRIAGDGTVRRR